VRRSKGATGEDVAVGSFVREFKAFAQACEHDRVIADHIAAAEGVDADFIGLAFAGDALASVAEGVGGEFAFFENDFEKARGGAAGGVFFEPMMHLDDFGVVRSAEDLGRTAGEGEEEIYPDGVVA